MCRDIDSGTRCDTRGHTQDNKPGQQISFSGKYQQRGLRQGQVTPTTNFGNIGQVKRTIFIFIRTLFYYTH